MPPEELRARADEFHEKLRALILEYPDVFGPRDCPDDPDHDCDESPLNEQMVLTSYLLSAQWDHLLEQSGMTDYISSPTASLPQTLGLSMITLKQLEMVI